MKTDVQKRQLIHDLRNPLNAALGISSLLEADASLGPSHRQKIRVLKSSIEDLCEIIGNTFDFDMQPGGSAEESVAEQPEKPITVLLVEDYPPNALVITTHLENLDYHYDLATTGEEALEKYSANHYDVILMDIQLPGIDGLEVTRRIRAIEKEKSLAPLPIIAISGLPEEKEDFLRLGMTDCLTKPIRLRQLKDMLDMHCGM